MSILPMGTNGLDILDLFMKDMNQYKLLTHEETIRLICLSQAGDKSATDELINHNIKLVIRYAKHCGTFKIPLLDHIQNGIFGLYKAIEMFDVSKGYHFSTYATWWIRRYISYWEQKTINEVYIPANLQNDIKKLDRVIEEFKQDHIDDNEPSIGYLADKTDFTEAKIRDILYTRKQQPCSLDGLKTKECDYAPTDTNNIYAVDSDSCMELRATLMELIALSLDGREQLVINMYYGIDAEQGYSFSSIGNVLGVSTARVQQIHKRALGKLYSVLNISHFGKQE